MSNSHDPAVPAHPDRVLLDIAEYTVAPAAGGEAPIAAARLCLMDTLACALDALGQPDCMRMLGPVVPGTVVPHGARVPGTGFVLDPAKATFDLGCMIRWLDYNDACSGALTTHPSDALAGLLMVGDWLSRTRVAVGHAPLAMRDVFEATIRVYELQGALGALNDFRRFGIDQPLLTRVAAAPVLTRMLGGTQDQVLNAVSNAFIESTLSVVRHAPNIGSRKNWATADASFGAVRIAMMAVQGEAGYPWVLTAKELGFHDARCQGEPLRFDGPFGESVIGRCMFKLVPAGMHGQTAGECAFSLHPLVKDRLGEIERIDIHCHRALKRIMDKPGVLRNAADRDHCVQYVVAVGLLNGRIDPDDYSDAFAADPRIDALRAKMTLTEDPRYTADFTAPDKRSSANAVQVFFKDGSCSAKVEREYPVGHPRRRAEAMPLLAAKFDAALKRRFAAEQCARIASMWDNAAALDAMPVHEFIDRLVL
jgi:2-methylcitrate dehydratase